MSDKLSTKALRQVILICKHAYLYKDFLSNFEFTLVTDTIRRYGKYGSEMRLSEKQIGILWEIKSKLYMETPK